MNKLTELVRRCKEYDGEILFKDGDIFVLSDKQYIDVRNHYNKEIDVNMVHPVLREGKYIYYVCPECSELHSIYKGSIKKGTKHNPGCCINSKKGSKFGVIFPDGKMKKYKARKIMIA